MCKGLLPVVLLPVLAWGQSYTASVRGTVTDTSKGAVPKAAVTVTDIDRDLKRSAQSDEAGRYSFTALPPGKYSLSVSASSFQKAEVPAFSLEVQQQTTIDVELKVGELTTTVEVQGTVTLLNTTAATNGQVIEDRTIQTAPLVSRNPLSLVMLTAGVVPTEGDAGGTDNVNFVANGNRNSTAEVVLDGAAISGIEQNSSITELKYQPSVDVIEEFKIQTNFFSAEFGNTGGSIVNMVTKSGTNEVHGVGYEFYRNASLNANSFFNNREGLALPDFSRHVFGGTMGGPVYIPRVYNGRSRTFFFVDYEGARQQNATRLLTSVPTVPQLTGDFSQTFRSNGKLQVIYNPFDTYEDDQGSPLRHPFPGNKIPASMQNPIAQKMLKYYPAATSDGDPLTHVNNFYKVGTNPSRGDKMDIKIDHNISERQRLTGRYSSDWGNSTPTNLWGNISGNYNNTTSRTQNFVLDYTRSQGPSTVMTVRASVLRNRVLNLPISTGFDSSDPNGLGLSPLFRSTGVYQFPNISVTGYRALGPGGWAMIRQGEAVGLINGSVTKIAGSHIIKTGAEFRQYFENYFQPGYPAGRLAFNRGITNEDPYANSSSQGNGIASMLLGWGSDGTLDTDYPTATASKYFGTYIQDDWKISRNLTLNLGVRYDFDIPRTERYDRLNWFDYGAVSPLAGKVPEFPNLKGVMMYAGGSNRRSPYLGDHNNVQPRIGFAYALGDRMSIRGGYGIYYSVSRASIKGEVGSAFRSGSSIQFSRDEGLTQYATLTNPFPNGLTIPPGPSRDPLGYIGLGFESYDPYTINPQVQQWSFSIQRRVPGDGVFEVQYTGTKGTHLSFGTDDVLGNRNKLDPMYWKLGRDALYEFVNNPFHGVIKNPQSLLSLPEVEYQQLLLAYPQYEAYLGGYTAPPYIGNSIYHAVQFKYEKRMSRGLSMMAHYTISKLISDSDSPGTDIDWLGGFTGLQNWKNLRQERAVATYDIPQRLIVNFTYDLPIGRGRAFGKNMHRVADTLVGGWSLSSILTFSSGYPIVPNLDSPDLLSGDQRPNLIGDPRTSGPASQRMEQYLNPNAFSQPDQDVYGTAPRTLPNYRTYGIRNGDFTLMKNFKFTERKYAQFRLESFNLTNTPTFGRPDEYYGSNTFGQITDYAPGRGARQLQLGIKLYY